MEILAFLIAIIILFVLISVKSSLSSRFNTVDQRLAELTKQLERLRAEQDPVVKRATKPDESATIAHAAPKVDPVRDLQEELRKAQLRDEAKRRQEALEKERLNRERIEMERLSAATQPEISARIEPVQNPSPIAKPAREPKPGFFERNPDLEKFIGENLANKIGIAILVIGIGFFVKYAIDQNWIGEIGRVFIGIACGGILLGVAHWLRKSFAAFSSVLVGGGIAVLYFTISIAFHEYHIFSQTAAFILMAVITGFTIMLAIAYDRVELAVLAILGGFGAPFMVSTGSGNYVVLFSYLLILNSGMMVLAYYKKWRIVNIVCYAFTIFIFGAWLGSRFEPDNLSMIRTSLLFATMFYLIFFAMNIVNNIKERTKFEALEIIMLLSNTFLYYSAGMVILNNELGGDYRGLFTASLGLFNFAFAYSLYKNARADRNLVFLLIGLVLTFISLAAPIQLEGNYITLFWAAESVLLFWLAQKSGIRLFTVASVIIQLLMLISVAMDWYQIYLDDSGSDYLMIFLNKGFITSVVVLASLYGIRHLLSREAKDGILKIEEYKVGLTVVFVLTLYLANLLELRHQLGYYLDSFSTSSVIVGCYNMFFMLCLLLAERQLTIPPSVKRLSFVWGVVAMFSYLLYYHEIIIDARNEYLTDTLPLTGFLFHYLLVMLLIAIVSISLRNIHLQPELVNSIKSMHWWPIVFFVVFIGSAELDHLVVLTRYDGQLSFFEITEATAKIGYPILWGITSFVLIAIGLQRKIKMLRIISLALLLITLLKLFIIDLRDISEAGKIAAFISLGVLLLVVSFMYQRLKKILLEDNKEEKQEIA